MEEKSKDPLHGKRLDAILEELVEYYQGFEKLGEQINIKCFTDNPSISSSLKFLRKTPGQEQSREFVSVCTETEKTG
jgi:uncharacterized protein (DUF2132 family)